MPDLPGVSGTAMVRLVITVDDGDYRFGMVRRVPGVAGVETWADVRQPETTRGYTSAEDCLTAARHALKRELKICRK